MRTWIGYAISVTLLGISAHATAQEPTDALDGSAAGCLPHSASRLPSHMDCGEFPRETLVIPVNIDERPIVVEMPDVVITDCEANIQFKYTQRGSIARVEGLVENETCAASAGSFTVSIRTSNDRFEQMTQEHRETWQRDDAESVAFSRDYEIGDDVDLIRVRTLRSMCKCTAAAE